MPRSGGAARPDSGRSEPTYGDLVRQYLDIRGQNPGVIVLFRVGSFYETLFEDAELVARVMGLKLSDRPSGGTAPPVPQCGFAHHALDAFLPRLLRHGYRVAVVEESEEEAGGVRRRTVVRTLTPGTVTDPALLPEDRPAYLLAVVPGDDPDAIGLAWTDVATGEFKVGEFSAEDGAAEIQRLDPAEVLVPRGGAVPEALLTRRNVTPVYVAEAEAGYLARAFPDATLDDMPLGRAAGDVVLRYLQKTGGAAAPRVDPPTAAGAADAMRLDAATQRHLELVETERGRSRDGSLLATLDHTVTPMGRRMLRAWLLRPLTRLNTITVRQHMVAELVHDTARRAALAEPLAVLADLERLAGRAVAGRVSVEDLRALGDASAQVTALAPLVAGAESPFLRALGTRRPGLADFGHRVAAVLAPPSQGDGHPIRPAASQSLAAALAEVDGAAAWQERYLSQLRRLPGLSKVKLERSATQGFYLEVPVNTPVPGEWMRRGGLQKVERYSTAALEQHAVALSEAEARVAEETRAIVAELRSAASGVAAEARDLARHVAAVDVLRSLAEVAAARGWVQPEVDNGSELSIRAGRHPVVEGEGAFQPNDAHLVGQGARDQVVVLTGPNMAGKSTWMRQVALITLLAQAGSFVPAEHAHIGLVDAIYTRIGAVDELAAGRSTFMVEMLETASVLKGATDRSLVLLDEIGRGTSTHDGMAIAWAVIEHLAAGPARPRAIVATHYHELAALHTVHPQVTLLRATVEERPDGVRFPHRIEPGAADRSFGIEVARLAGLPDTVLARAREVADAVEPLSAEIGRLLGDIASDRQAQRRASLARAG